MADKTIRYKGEFDASQILASLKSIRSEMEKNGAAPSLFKGVDKDIDKAESLVKELLAQINTGFKSTKEVDNFKKKFDTLTQTFAKARIGLNDINKVENFSKGSKNLEELRKKLDDIQTAEVQVSKNAADAADKLKSISTKEARAEIKKAIDDGEELEAVMKRIATTQFSKGQSSLNKIFSKGNTDKIKETFTNSSIDLSVGSSISSNEANVNAYRQALLALATTSISVEDAFANLKKTLDEEGQEYLESSEFAKAYMEDLKNLSLEAAKAKDSGLKSSAGAIGKAISTMGGAGAVDASGNLHITEKENEAIQKYIDLLREKGQISEQISQEEAKALAAALAKQQEFTNSLSKTANEYDVLEKQTDELTNSTRQQVEAQQALDGAFDRLGNAVKQVLSLGTAWRTFRNIVSQTFNDVKQLDKAFGSIAMVTKYSVADMWSQYGTYAEMANKLGQSTQSVVEASGLFYQQGLDTVEALKLTEDTMKLATLAGLDFKDATSQMTAALRAFHMEMDQGAHVTDVYAEIAAHAAVDVKGLSEAMSACAAIANSAGMSFENTSAMLATMVEATQEAPKNLGTAMKTILARFTELKNDVAGTLESEFEDLDYNKVDKALKSVGISIKDASGQFRNMDEVLLELSSKWNTLDRNSQRYIATIAAGSRQQSRFIALMENYDRTMELVGVAEESAGKSSEQFAKYQDTVEYKLNRLKNAWEQTRTTFLESDTYKSAIDMLTSIVSKIENLNLGKIIGIGALGITAGKSFVGNLLKTIKGSINNFKTAGANISSAITKSLKSDKQSKQQFKLEYQVELDKQKFEQEKTNLANNVESLKATLAGVWDYSNGSDALIEEFKKLGMSEEDAAARAKELINIYQQSGPNIVTFQQALDEAGKSEEFVAQAAADMSNGVRQADEATKNSTQALENYKQKSQKTGQVVGQAFTALANSISMGMMTLLATGDWEDALDTMGTTLLTSAASMGISFISQMVATGTAAGGGLAAAFTEAGGPVALAIIGITAAVGGLIMGISALAGSTNSLEDERKRLEEYSENLEKTISSTKSDIKEHKEQKSTLESLLESYDRLNGKISKTEEEQEEYDATIKALKEDYSDLIIAYDNENNTIKISNELRERKLSLMKQELELAQQSLVNAEHEQIKTTEKQLLNNVAIEYKNNYSVSEENATKIANREKITAAEILNDQYDSHGNLTRNNADSRNEFAQKFFGMDYNDLNKTEKEGLKDALDYVFGNTDSYSDWMKRLGEDFRATTEEMRQSLEDNFKKATDHFDDYFTVSLENIEEEFGDTINSTEKTLRAVERAAAGDKKLSDLELNDWEGSASDNNLENYEKILEQHGGEKLASTLNMTTTSMADAVNKIYTAAAEGAWGVEDDYEDFIEGLNETERQVAKAIGITEDTYQNYWENLGQDDDKTAKQLGEHLLDSVNAAALTTDADGLSDSIRQQAIDLVNSTADLTLEEYNKRVEELNNTLDTNFSEGSEEYKKKIRELNDDLLKNSEEAGKIFGNQVSGKTNTERAELYKAYSTYGNKDFVSSMSNILDNSGINKQAVTSALQFEWKDILPSDKSAQLKKFRQNMKDTMGDAFDPKVADELFEKLYKNAQSYNIGGVIKNQLNDAQFTEYLLGVNKAVEDSYDNINKLISTYNQQGSLDFETLSSLETIINSLNESGLDLVVEDFYELDSVTGKVKLNVSKLSEIQNEYTTDLEATYKAEKRVNDEALKAQEAKIAALEAKGDTAAHEQLKYEYKILAELKEQNKEYDEQLKKIQAAGALHKQNLDLLKEQVNAISSLGSAYKSALSDVSSKGKLTYSSATALYDALQSIELAGPGNFEDYVTDTGELQIRGLKSFIEAQRQLLEESPAANKVDILKLKLLGEELEEYEKELSNVESAEAESTIATNNKAKAIEDEAEAQQNLIDKIKAYNDLLTGSDNYRQPLDDLYNYTTQIEALEKAASRAKDALDNMMPGDNAKKLLQSYYSNTKDYIKYLQAENQVRATSIGNAENTLQTQLNQKLSSLGMSNIDVSSLYTKIGDRYQLDINRLNNLGINDTMKDFIANTINSMNELQKGIEDNNDKIKKKQQEVLQYKKEINNKYVSLEDDMKNALKEKYQQEIDDLKAKYEAMETADSDYLQSLEEAINKQRELRERANEWDDLATKEKKLSLMQRDTSGANQLEVQKLEKEVENDRQKLLDEGIDDVINNLKELYDLQKEERDLEIEYRESLLTDAKLLAEITEALEGIHTADDLVNWYSNITDWSGKSNANIEQMKTGWEESFSSLEVYRAQAAADIDDTIDSTAQEVIDTISQTSESLTTKISDSLTTTSEEVKKAIEQASKDMTEAERNIETARKATMDATKAAKEAEEKLANARKIATETTELSAEEIQAEKKAIVERIAAGGTGAEHSYNFNTVLSEFKNKHLLSENAGIQELADVFKQYGYDVYYSQQSGHLILETHMEPGYTKGMRDQSYGQQGYQAYATGGLVNYTGPAWVDGTPTSPEAFLSAEDTRRIGEAAQLLADLPILNGTAATQNISNSITGDTTIALTVNFDSVSEEYDADRVIDLMKQKIVEAAQFAGSNVILQQ